MPSIISNLITVDKQNKEGVPSPEYPLERKVHIIADSVRNFMDILAVINYSRIKKCGMIAE